MANSNGAGTKVLSDGNGTSEIKGTLNMTSDTLPFGYATGAGGAVTQITSRATGVTLNNVCGTITTDDTSLAAAAEATFTVTNSTVAATDTVVVSMQTITTGTPVPFVTDVSAGSFDITISNLHASTADTSADLINFAVIKSVTS